MTPSSDKTKIFRLLGIRSLLVLLLFACSDKDDYPQNIILFIGDGMDVAHITAGKIVAGNSSVATEFIE